MSGPQTLSLAQGRALLNQPTRENKFNARRTLLDDIWFDSAREAQVWAELSLRQRAGKIGNLRRQVRYKIIVNDQLVYTYRADFAFDDYEKRSLRVIDVKSPATAQTRSFVIVKKLMKAVHGIEVEVWM